MESEAQAQNGNASEPKEENHNKEGQRRHIVAIHEIEGLQCPKRASNACARSDEEEEEREEKEAYEDDEEMDWKKSGLKNYFLAQRKIKTQKIDPDTKIQYNDPTPYNDFEVMFALERLVTTKDHFPQKRVHISAKSVSTSAKRAALCTDVEKTLTQGRVLSHSNVCRSVLQCYIRNMPGPPSPLIENYLGESSFWHVATIGRGCKLDPKFISAFIERWRPETHTFHLLCGECTITLEDVQLQLGLSVDGYAVTGSAQSADWGAVCYELLGAIPEKINGGRIEMGWLRDTFLEPDNNSTELERIRYAQAYILGMRGYLMSDLSRNRVHLKWLLKLADFRAAGELSWGSVVLATLYQEMCGATPPNKAKIRGCLSLLQSWAWFCFLFLRPRVNHPYTFPLIMRWNHSASYVGIPTSLEDIRLLLDQRSEAQFQWTPYEDPAIRAIIPDEFFQNPNIWLVKIPLVLDDEHKVDLRLLNMDWPRHWSEYIEMWENQYDYIPIREPIIVPVLACMPEYMPWFRIHGKPYLLSEEERRRQIRMQRERRGPLNTRRRDNDAGPLAAPT
ncbi:hypothetical protein CXB51_019168 [Gossypium anomalum]|uniref:Aminotransferase-like plant mobile domain-containing protein n=1 Tax=Gossypium anomalum TaxID=47600 RepID=A0A8J6CZK8_9ROSI|nr:hypothetical protein CXB51_019168 [Gossypium anomalum]